MYDVLIRACWRSFSSIKFCILLHQDYDAIEQQMNDELACKRWTSTIELINDYNLIDKTFVSFTGVPPTVIVIRLFYT